MMGGADEGVLELWCGGPGSVGCTFSSCAVGAGSLSSLNKEERADSSGTEQQ